MSVLSKAELYSTDDDSILVRDESFYERVMALRRDHRNLLDSLRACHAALEAWVDYEAREQATLAGEAAALTRCIRLTEAAGVEWPEDERDD